MALKDPGQRSDKDQFLQLIGLSGPHPPARTSSLVQRSENMMEERTAGHAVDPVTVKTLPELLQVRLVLQHLQTSSREKKPTGCCCEEASGHIQILNDLYSSNLGVALVKQEAPRREDRPDGQLVGTQEEGGFQQVYRGHTGTKRVSVSEGRVH